MTRRILCKILFIVVAVFALLALPGIVQAQGQSDQALEHARQVQERHTGELMALPDVVGTAIGLDQGNRAVVKVFTVRGGVPGIPGILEGVPVQPVVTGEFYALAKGSKGGRPGGGGSSSDPTAHFRPAPIGVSTGHPDITAGTIGCRVKNGSDVFALSNNHVYANENAAKSIILYGALADPVLQPGPYDGGTVSNDVLGTLFDFCPIDFSGGDNTIDAAIALCSTDTLGNSTLPDGYGTPKSTTVEALVNQKVKKYGRTTGLTKGQVYALNATVNVGYDTGVAHFVGQIIITPGSFSAGGDSGSLIVVDDRRGKTIGPDDNKPVGLLFAGSSLYTIANPIDLVLSEFRVSIDGE